MILSKEFYDRCSPSYEKVIDELEQKLANIKNDQNDDQVSKATQTFFIIIEFSSNYLTPKEYWDECYSVFFELDYYEVWEKQGFKAAVRAYFHFQDRWSEQDVLKYSCVHFKSNAEYEASFAYKHFRQTDFQKQYYDGYVIEEIDVSYPHSWLKQCFREFEKNTSRLPPKKLIERYEQAKQLYPKIKAVENDLDQWIKAMDEANDFLFVKDNIESRLGRDCFNIVLWKLYLAYLKQVGEYKLLLETYSKYCRFFLDDREMLEEYKKAMIEYGPINVQWDNLFDFEEQKVVEGGGDKKIVRKKEIVPFDKKLCSTFYDTYQIQDFSLPAPIIRYLLKNSPHQVLRKLFDSCKYFYDKQSTPICYRLHINHDSAVETKFLEESITLKGSTNSMMFFKNTYITGSIIFEYDYQKIVPTGLMSEIIPRLFQCVAKYIILGNQHLTFNEFKFLIQHGGVIQLDASDSQILKQNGDLVELEEVMEYLPNIHGICFGNIKVNANTAHLLASKKFYGKIHQFSIGKIYGEAFDPNEFLKFCDSNRDADFFLRMHFNETFDGAFVERVKQMMSYNAGFHTNPVCMIFQR